MYESSYRFSGEQMPFRLARENCGAFIANAHANLGLASLTDYVREVVKCIVCAQSGGVEGGAADGL